MKASRWVTESIGNDVFIKSDTVVFSTRLNKIKLTFEFIVEKKKNELK